MSSLNTFGAILTYAIEQESRLADYYKKAGNADQASAADKRRGKLERPIEGLDEANYTMNLDDTSTAGQKAVALTAARFYSEVAPSINVRDAQRILEKCGKEYTALA